MKTLCGTILAAAVASCAAAGQAVAVKVADAMKQTALCDVRLKGYPGAKLDDLIRERVSGEFARRNVFAEARRAFRERDDDERGHGGLWRGEFWGKQMIGVARVADYLRDPSLLAFVREECRRMMELQDADGEIGGTFAAADENGGAFNGLTLVGDLPDYKSVGTAIFIK
ncbi:MAG: hypothetical protein IJI36_09735 [Kiritimatiellae bacterium]|nr:hypothetical protein [Kiritimatiellia bacterium]